MISACLSIGIVKIGVVIASSSPSCSFIGGIETTDWLGYFVGNLPDEKLGLFLI
jgi:hypothetical protein